MLRLIPIISLLLLAWQAPALAQLATFDSGSIYDLDPKLEQSAENYIKQKMIGKDLILTNYHCVQGKGNIEQALLTMGYLKPRTHEGVAQYPVKLEPVEASQKLDYAILHVEGEPGNKWGQVTLSAKTPDALSTLFIIHHPGGFPKYVSRVHSAARAHAGGVLRQAMQNMTVAICSIRSI